MSDLPVLLADPDYILQRREGRLGMRRLLSFVSHCRSLRICAVCHRPSEHYEKKRGVCRWCRSNQTALYHQQRPVYYSMLASAKARAKRAGVPFALSLSDFPNTLPTRCPVLGIPIYKGENGRMTDNSPSLDRIVPELGYIPSNVVVISYKANAIKRNATPQEIRRVADFYERLVPDQ